MKRKPTANPSSLFLLELIFAILFFSITSAVCVQVFVKSHILNQEAQILTLASQKTRDAAELLVSTDSLSDSFSILKDSYPDCCTEQEDTVTIFYNEDFLPCSAHTSVYQLTIEIQEKSRLLCAHLTVSSAEEPSIFELETKHYLQRRPFDEG